MNEMDMNNSIDLFDNNIVFHLKSFSEYAKLIQYAGF